MKAIQQGNTFRIYDNSMKTFDQLPAQAYLVECSQMTGPFLSKYSDIEISEKIYGVHLEKVEKVLKSFSLFSRNLGVILSGDKGIGKSLFSKILAQEAIKRGYPLLVVNSWFPGIGEYLNSIEQEVVVLFDEFDKTFKGDRDGNGPQVEMLTLFDGIAQGKKLFCVTCNDISHLNNYLVNRPGRFHYHFRFEYPSPAEIREYMEDKLNPAFYGEIDKVIAFSRKIDLNYDCLRAISFELGLGLSFEDAIKDLNILNLSSERYNLIVRLSNGLAMKLKNVCLDTFDDGDVYYDVEDPDTSYDIFNMEFSPSANRYDMVKGCIVIDKDNLKINWEDYIINAAPPKEEDLESKPREYSRQKEIYDLKLKYKDVEVECLELHRVYSRNLHYMV